MRQFFGFLRKAKSVLISIDKFILLLFLVTGQKNNAFSLNQESASELPVIKTLETINSFNGEWCSANGEYLYGKSVTDNSVVLRKGETGQSFETRGNVSSLHPSFKIEDRIFSTSTPDLIFIPVRNSVGNYLVKSRDGGATFANVLTFGEGNGTDGLNTLDVRILRGFLELKTEIPGGGGIGTLLIGEYNVNHSRISGSTNDRVRILKSVDNGDTWTNVVEWNTNGTNQVGHIHAMKQDPYTGEIYICTGDDNGKAGIIKWDGSSEWTDNRRLSQIALMNGFKVFTGSQRYRACDVLFDENFFYTFADTQKPNNPTGSESGIWRGTKDFSSYTRMDNNIFSYDPMHIGWYGEKIGNTFIFTTSREYVNSSNAWKELNTQVYISTDGIHWYVSGATNWRERTDPTTSKYITNVFSFNDKLYIDCDGGAGHYSTIQCELTRDWKSSEDPVILHPVYYVGTWNAAGNDANPGTTPDAPKRTLNNILIGNRICAGARVKVAEGNFNELNINPLWSAPVMQGRGSVIIEGQGMNKTHIIRSSGTGNTYGMYVEAARTLTNAQTPLILKDLDFYLTVDGGAGHSNYVISNNDTYIKTIDCKIGNAANDDSPLINLNTAGSKYVSENSFHIANSNPGIYKSIVKANSGSTSYHFKNCIILNAYDAFANNYSGIDFSLKGCNLYGIEHSGVLFESNWNTIPVIKNCIFSCGASPIINQADISGTEIDYNFYNNALSNLTDGGHSIFGTDPLFVDPAGLDFNLKSGSLCLRSGIHLDDVLYDFIKNGRGDPPSIGAYESTFFYVIPVLSVTPDEIIIDSISGATGEFEVVSNKSWIVKDDATWLSRSSSVGDGNETYSVSSTSANTSTSSRSAHLTFIVDGINPVIVKVTQSGQHPAISVNPERIIIDSISGATGLLTVKSNTDWNVTDNATWLSQSTSSGTGNGTVTVTAISPNTSIIARIAKVTFSSDGADPYIVTVIQSGHSPVLSVSPASISIDQPTGATASINVNSNTPWNVTTNVTWLSSSASSGTGNGTIIVTATNANTSITARSASMTFSSDGTSPVVVTVTQSGQNPVLSVNPSVISINSIQGATGELNIASNTIWNVSDNAGWLNLSSSSGNGNGVITVTATEANTATSSRSANVTFLSDGMNPVIVTVNQAGENPTKIILTEKDFLKIYPNPVSGILTIEYNDDSFKTMYILNSQGVILKKRKAEGPIEHIDFSHIGKGLFIIQFNNLDGGNKRVKVISR